jgi:hypothetical protein
MRRMIRDYDKDDVGGRHTRRNADVLKAKKFWRGASGTFLINIFRKDEFHGTGDR